MKPETGQSPLQRRVYEVIFGTDTRSGKLFDLILIWMILLSVLALMVDSVNVLSEPLKPWLYRLEWLFTLAFTLEYALRIYSSPAAKRYVFSFYGLVDLVSILPTYLALLYPGVNYLLIIRLLRVLRIFRVLKLVRYLSDANLLMRAIVFSRRKILVFFVSVLVLSTIFGSLMYLVEGPQNGFSSIPKSIYWTIVTITTVGYGDITPHTPLGQVIAAAAMLTGYSILAVPTGIFTAELANEMQKQRAAHACPDCLRAGHETDANYCRFCGGRLKNAAA